MFRRFKDLTTANGWISFGQKRGENKNVLVRRRPMAHVQVPGNGQSG